MQSSRLNTWSVGRAVVVDSVTPARSLTDKGEARCGEDKKSCTWGGHGNQNWMWMGTFVVKHLSEIRFEFEDAEVGNFTGSHLLPADFNRKMPFF